MSIATAVSGISAEALESTAIQLSDLSDEEREGIDILSTLQTVVRGRHLGDSPEMMAINTVRNEQTHVDFVRYVRRIGGYEAPAQIVVVERLLTLAEKIA